MRGINYYAGLGTILIFIGIFSFKALFPKNITREDGEMVNHTSSGVFKKGGVILIGLICTLLGIFLIVQSFKNT